MIEDRLRGALYGHVLGDVLGAPHEFTSVANYTGFVEHPLVSFSCGVREAWVGRPTDDSEMMMALAHAIADGEPYSERAVEEYIAWANPEPPYTPCPYLGGNTAALFLKATPSEYRERHRRLYSGREIGWSQSNGCLMRAAPLAAIDSLAAARTAAATDCALTNPHAICIAATEAYVELLWRMIRGETNVTDSLELAPSIAHLLVDAQKDAKMGRFTRSVIGNSCGWVEHALYAALWAASVDQPYQNTVDAVIRAGGDTDTNAAVAGAVAGAAVGEGSMLNETRTGVNIARIAFDERRPSRYQSVEIDAVVPRLLRLQK